jgi:hypothetical protein
MLFCGARAARVRRWIVLAGVIGTLCVVSSNSTAIKDTVFLWLFRHGVYSLYDSRRVHALLHLLGFMLAGTILFAGRQTRSEANRALLLLLTAAVLSEALETWRYKVPLEWLDILNDFTGALLAFLLCRITRDG